MAELEAERGFPRLYAAASLKREDRNDVANTATEFSAALCRGLIEARMACGVTWTARSCFPRLYAAASLKQSVADEDGYPLVRFSAALCRGLIEAGRRPRR